MKINGLESKLHRLLTAEATEATPEIIRIEAEITEILDRIEEALEPIRQSIHKELYPEEYEYE